MKITFILNAIKNYSIKQKIVFTRSAILFLILVSLIQAPIKAQITEYIPETDTLTANLYAVDTVNNIVPDEISVNLYIEKYKHIAVLEMKRSGIPASITLAQGIMESRYGNSRLAKKANNHFGIKCRSEWHGKRAIHNDEQKNECFRAYPSPIQSFIDHSNFLAVSPRYAVLFLLSICDYKGWAQGLEELGYSTSGHYAEKLSSLIESHQLQAFDRTEAVSPDSLNAVTLTPTDECYRRNLLQVTHPKKIRNKQALSQQAMAAIDKLHQFHRFGDIYQNVAPSRDSILAVLAAARTPVTMTTLPPDSIPADNSPATASAAVEGDNKTPAHLLNLGNTGSNANSDTSSVAAPTLSYGSNNTIRPASPPVNPTTTAHLPLSFTYKALSGDTLEGIARQFKILPEKIKNANPLIDEKNTMSGGEKVVIPVY